MSFWELRVFMLACDVCGIEVRVECAMHVRYCLPEGWTVQRVGTTEVVRCPAHAVEGTE